MCKIFRLRHWELCKSNHLSVLLLLLLLSSVVSSINDLSDKKLFMAARKGDITIVNQLLADGASPNNWTNWQAKSALIAAEERHRTEVVLKLIASKADVNHQDHNGDSALHFSVWRFDTDVTRALLDAGAKPDPINSRGFTPMKYASFASNYHAHTVQLFIDAGANPNLQDEFGQTAMHFAVDQNKLDVVKTLLQAGADPSLKTKWNISPFDIAVDENNTEIIDQFKASTNSNKLQTSPGFLRLDLAARQLYEAARGGDQILVDQMLFQGVAPDAYKDWQGSTSLILAAAKGHTKIVQQLVEAGADVNYKDHHGSTALHVSVQSHETNMTQTLLKAGADPNSQDTWGATPLLITMEPGYHPDIALLLIMAQAKPNLQDKIGVTALHMAVDKNMTEIVDSLLQAGARPDIRTRWGKTAIDVAKESELTSILSLLEDAVSKLTTPRPSTSSKSISSNGSRGVSFLTGALYTLLVIGLLVLLIAGVLLYRRRYDSKGPPSIYLDARRIFREPIIDAFHNNILTQSLVPSRASSLIPEAPPTD